MNILTKSIITVSLAASIAIAGGYKIPEQSLNSTALAGAYVANANGADASYFNPANMMWNDNVSQYEAALTYIYLPEVTFESTIADFMNGKSKSEEFLMPTFHYTSKEKDGIRYGFSMVSPAGLSKRWDSPAQKASAEEFTLKTVELNPTIATKLSENLAIGAGLRVLYSEGIVKSDSGDIDAILSTGDIQRDMEGDSIDYGYNVALTYKPTNDLTLAATYRSKIDLTEEGNAKLYYNGALAYNGDTGVTIPVPAALNLALAKQINNTTYEFTYEKTYWSAYKELDFTYPIASLGALDPYFNDPKAKSWKDTNTYRIGITHKYNDDLTVMAGFAIDESPAPESTIGYELPDSDAKLYSIGFEKRLDKSSSFGMSYLRDVKDNRTVVNADVAGEFSDGGAHLLTVAYKHSF
jgi:long-chain fatty acid transport protein